MIILQNVLIKHISQSMMNNTQWFLCIRAVWKKMKYIGLIKMPKSLALECGEWPSLARRIKYKVPIQ